MENKFSHKVVLGQNGRYLAPMARTHGNKEFSSLLREIEKLGFRVEITKRAVYKIYPPEHIGGPMYITHGTPMAVKAVINEFRKLYGVDLKPRKA